jgi:hypothetical protein
MSVTVDRPLVIWRVASALFASTVVDSTVMEAIRPSVMSVRIAFR